MPILYAPLGDCGLRISFGTEISPSLNQKVMACQRSLQANVHRGIIDVIPGYTTLTIYYDPLLLSYDDVRHQVEKFAAHSEGKGEEDALVFHIPTCYEHPFSLDLHEVAKRNDLTEEDVITLHSQKDYYIYMLGFLPGFPYLAGLDKRIATPRLPTPRRLVERGSVGIAGEQTGIYPLPSPGGWRIIGKTPLQLFNVAEHDPILLKAGHYVRFHPVSSEEYAFIEQEVKVGSYKIKTTRYKGEKDDSN